MTDFLQRLKQRKLVQWALAYLAFAWVLLQVLDMVGDRFGWPDGLLRGCLVTAGVGFFVTLLLAWYHGDRGEQRVSGVELLLLALVLTVGGGLLWKFAGAPEVASTNAAAASVLGVTSGIVADVAEIPEKSVAVLPFVALTPGVDEGYFADGLTEEIINALTTLPDLLVTARTSAFHFKGTNTPIPEIAQTLGVAHVVEGSVRRDGDRVRITAQLIRAEGGFHLWSQTYDRKFEDVFAVQTDIAEQVAQALGVLLDEQVRARMAVAGVRDVDAFLAYQRGMELSRAAHDEAPQVPTLHLANAEFDIAIASKPDFAQAHLMHADLFAHILMDELIGKQVDAKSVAGFTKEEAMRHLAADLQAAAKFESDPGQRLVIGAVRTFLSDNWRGLGAQLDRAFAKWDNCRHGLWMDPMGTPLGRAAEVHRQALKHIRCDPLEEAYWDGAAFAALMLDRPQETLQIVAEAERVGTGSVSTNDARMFALLALGRHDEAGDLLSQGIVVSPELHVALPAAAGRTNETASALTWFQAQDSDLHQKLIAHAIAGDREGANRIVAIIDAEPLGAAVLTRAAGFCFCGAPFDLSATPNFARQLKKGNLPWPPKSPIDWPLKDW